MITPTQTQPGPEIGAEHTPGPWMTDDETVNHGPIIIQRNGSLEVAVVYGDGREQRAANARLIAAAPELLQACKAALVLCNCFGAEIGEMTLNGKDHFRLPDMLRAAIRRVEGRTP